MHHSVFNKEPQLGCCVMGTDSKAFTLSQVSLHGQNEIIVERAYKPAVVASFSRVKWSDGSPRCWEIMFPDFRTFQLH